MPFTNYKQLVAEVARWLARDDLNAEIRDFIWLAECDVQRDIATRLNDAIFDGESVADQDYIELPDDYIEGGFLNWTSDTTIPNLEISSLDVMSRIQKDPPLQALTGGDVRVGSVFGNRIYIGKPPGQVTYRLFYKSGVQHLSDAKPKNLILREYPDLLLFGALILSAPFLGADERIQTWQIFYSNAFEKTKQAEWRAKASSGVLRMRTEVNVR